LHEEGHSDRSKRKAPTGDKTEVHQSS